MGKNFRIWNGLWLDFSYDDDNSNDFVLKNFDTLFCFF